MSPRAHAGVCVERERSVLFRVGVGDEGVNHEIAVKPKMSERSIVYDLRRGTSTYTCSNFGSFAFEWWMSRAGIVVCGCVNGGGGGGGVSVW